jgi:hypothetical protein
MAEGGGGVLQGGQGAPPEFTELALAMMLDNPEPCSAEEARVQLRNGDVVHLLRSRGSIREGEVGTVVGTAADGHDDRSQHVLVDFGGDGRSLYVPVEDVQLQPLDHNTAHSQRDMPARLGASHTTTAHFSHARAAKLVGAP